MCTQSKLVVLKSLASFLSHAIKSAWHDRESAEASSSTVTTPTWYLSSSFASSNAFDAFDALLRPIISTQGSREPIRTWRDEVSPEEDGFVGPFPLACGISSAAWTIGDLNDVDAAISTLKGDGTGEGTSADVSCAVVSLIRTVMRQTSSNRLKATRQNRSLDAGVDVLRLRTHSLLAKFESAGNGVANDTRRLPNMS